MALNETVRFLAVFLGKPGTIGAVAPSSRHLARCMAEWIDWPNVRAAAEYGPGTGAFTGEILNRLSPGSRFFAIELEPAMAEAVKRRFPQVTVHRESAAKVRNLCDREGIANLDAIVSGLPWAAFPEKLQRELLNAMMTVLPPGGQFVTFAYLQGLLIPAGRRFRKLLGTYFSEVNRSPTVWRNTPPAFVYRCRR
jgi:phosphatidylethanolamine/phosphatidyl-N-methylethanolamine N-methyltransferase